jgi:hypothetical protein
MKDKQDGRGIPDYDAETEDDIRRIVRDIGKGGTGLHESKSDAARRGITPATTPGSPPDAPDRPEPPEDGGRGH